MVITQASVFLSLSGCPPLIFRARVAVYICELSLGRVCYNTRAALSNQHAPQELAQDLHILLSRYVAVLMGTCQNPREQENNTLHHTLLAGLA